MDVVYIPPAADYPPRYGGSTVRRTQSTHDEVSRILDWNYDVATSSPASAVGYGSGRGPAGSATALARRPARFPDTDEPYGLLRRSVTTTTTTMRSSPVIEPAAPSPRENSRGVSAALIGAAAVGMAAGAALTYTMIKHDRTQAPRHEFDAPTFQRRSTFPGPYPDRSGRYVEVERTVEKIRYPSDLPGLADRQTQPTYLARYSQAGTPRSREVDDVYGDSRSHHSSRYKAPGSSTRARSEAPASRKPLLLTQGEHRSYVSSKPGVSTGPVPIRRSATYDVGERDSYVSARTHRTSSTTRGPLAALPAGSLTHRPKPASRATTATIRPSGGPPYRALHSTGKQASYTSARNVPLPPSGVGSSHARWDDETDSIAPSDSISCVGSRRSTRSYR